MKLTLSVFLPALISSHFISKRSANQALKRGESVGVKGFFEEVFRSSDMERECIEEQCNYEEWMERAENDYAGVRKEAKLLISPDAKTMFEDVYIQCYEKLKVMELNDPEKIDFRSSCVEVFLREAFPKYFEESKVDPDSDDDDGQDSNDSSHYDY